MKKSPGLHILIIGVAGNNELSKQQLYTIIEQPLIRHITKHFGAKISNEDILEIFSQVYLLILVKACTYRGEHGEASAWGWAYRIARNQANKWLKAQKRFVQVTDDSDDSDDFTDDENLTRLAFRTDPDWIGQTVYLVEDQALERILMSQMEECFTLLSQREKKVLRMYFSEDMPMEAIAQHFGVTRTRIHQILHGVYKKCRSNMKVE